MRQEARFRPVAAALLAATAGCAIEPPPAHDTSAVAAAVGCDEISVSVHCGRAPSVRLVGGVLWAAFEHQKHVYVSRSDDLGESFSAPVRATSRAEDIETNGENRPKIEVVDGAIFLSWTRRLEGRFTADIRFTRSLDGGTTFEPARTINEDGLVIGHRFESLHVDERGDLYLVWVDKRDLVAATQRGEEYRGAAIYYTVSTDRGATFLPNRRVADHACECCRIATADVAGGGVAIVWRHVFEGQIRDHAFATLGARGVETPLQRATDDGWRIEACPHHGPSMWRADGGYHLAWFTASGERPAALYGFFDPRTGELLEQTPIATAAAAHPFLIGTDAGLLLVWKQQQGDRTEIRGKRSKDRGRTWSEAGPIAQTEGASDYPFLVAEAGQPYLVWHTTAEGLRILPAG